MSVDQLKEMATIHLQNVAQAIAELKTQKQSIENEIVKLSKYYSEKSILLSDENVSNVQVD